MKMNPISILLYFLLGVCLFSFGMTIWQVLVVAVITAIIEMIAKEKK